MEQAHPHFMVLLLYQKGGFPRFTRVLSPLMKNSVSVLKSSMEKAEFFLPALSTYTLTAIQQLLMCLRHTAGFFRV